MALAFGMSVSASMHVVDTVYVSHHVCMPVWH